MVKFAFLAKYCIDDASKIIITQANGDNNGMNRSDLNILYSGEVRITYKLLY